jgi:hypothetical protein
MSLLVAVSLMLAVSCGSPLDTNLVNVDSVTSLSRTEALALMHQNKTHTVTQEELKTQVLSFIASDKAGRNVADNTCIITGEQRYTKTYQTGFSSSTANERSATADTDASDITFTVFTLENDSSDTTGFALACDDVRIGNVLAVVEDGSFDSESPFMEMVRSRIDAYVRQTIAVYNTVTDTDIQLASEKYGQIQRSLSRSSGIGNYHDYDELPLPNYLVSTRWGQGYPYNRVLMSVTNSSSVLQMGSDIVSLAQIIAYHQQPSVPLMGVLFGGPQPIEFFRDRYSTNPNTRVFFEDMSFEWSGMKSAPIADSLALAYQQEISTLMFQIAALAGKTWATNGTSAGVDAYAARNALVAFGHIGATVDPYAGVYTGTYGSINPYYSFIKPDLLNGHPLYATASNTAGARAGWVIDNCQVKTANSTAIYSKSTCN